MACITAFVSNRGGAGKSSLASQLAPAVALAHPDRIVLLVDLSIQGDATTFLLGGVAEPVNAAPGVRTRGGEVFRSLPREKCAAALVEKVLAPAAAPAPPPPAAHSYFWRGGAAAATAAAAPVFDWKAYAVRPRDVHPAGNCPANLYLVPGGKDLYGVPFEGLAPALRNALGSTNAIVLLDTDAELSERGASLAGIAAADYLAMVVSTSWTDYLRTLDDPANSLFAALAFISASHPDLTPRIRHLIFNNVQKRSGAPGGPASAPTLLPFTPPAASLDALVDIASHLRGVAADSGHGRHFAGPVGDTPAFLRAYVTGVPTFPETAWQASAVNGQPLVCALQPKEPETQAAVHLHAVAHRLAE